MLGGGGTLWLRGSGRSRGVHARGGPGSAADPSGTLPRGLLRFPCSDCFLSCPPSRKGQEAIEGRKLVGLSHKQPARRMGGSATTGVPSSCQGLLQGGGGRWSLQGRYRPGWEVAGQPPFPSLPEPGNPSPQPQSCLEKEHDVNKPPSTVLPAKPCLAWLLLPAPVGAGHPRDGHVPSWAVSLVASGQSLGQDVGQGTPEGSSGELMGIQGYCKKYLGIARRMVWGCAQPS